MPKRRSGPKVLVVGHADFAGVACVDWLAPQPPNIADFDIVFVDSVTLTELIDRANREGNLSKAAVELLNKNLSRIRVGVAKVLRSEGSVYGIVCPEASLEYKLYQSSRSNSDWLPLPVTLVDEPGDTLALADVDEGIVKRFERYLDRVKSWDWVFWRKYTVSSLEEAVKEHAHDLGRHLRERWFDARAGLTSVPIATDRQGNPVAEVLRYDLFAPSRYIDYDEADYEADAAFTSGPLVVLVPPTEVTSEEGVRILLQDVCGIGIRSVPPSWVHAVKFPRDDELRAAISAAEGKVRESQAALEELLQKKEEKEKFKAILYEDGPPLQEGCQKTFEAVGMKTTPSPVSDEFMIELEGQSALIEVSGSKRSVSQRDVSQLFKDMGNYFAETGQSIKGIFIGNPWRNIPPGERDTKDRPMFPDNVVGFAKRQRIALVSTLELFKAHCGFLEGHIDSESLFRWLMDGEGVVKVGDAASPSRSRTPPTET
ncbi:MAG: hypothetical protein WBF66_09990 [Dehalococcoidia bacterium]